MARHKKNDTSNKPQWTGMPSAKNELEEIRTAINSTYDIYSQMNTCKEELADIYGELKAKYGMPKKVFNFLAKNNYTGTFMEVISSNNELTEAFEAFDSKE